MLTVRDLDPVVQGKLRRRAAQHGRSMEAEVPHILAAAVEQDVEEPDLVGSIRRHFYGADFSIELPDRSTSQQRGRQPFRLVSVTRRQSDASV